MNILPGTPLRKQVRKAVHESEKARKAWQGTEKTACRPPPKLFALIFCFAAVSGVERELGQDQRLTGCRSRFVTGTGEI
jgi:hypothetical protein